MNVHASSTYAYKEPAKSPDFLKLSTSKAKYFQNLQISVYTKLNNPNELIWFFSSVNDTLFAIFGIKGGSYETS